MEDIESTAPAEPLAAVSAEELLPDGEKGLEPSLAEETKIKAVLEAIIYVTEEPLTLAQIAGALGAPAEQVNRLLSELAAEYEKPEHGLTVREVAGGYKMATKAEHHEAVRAFVKSLKPALKSMGRRIPELPQAKNQRCDQQAGQHQTDFPPTTQRHAANPSPGSDHE